MAVRIVKEKIINPGASYTAPLSMEGVNIMMGLGLLVPLLLIGAIAYAVGWRPAQFNNPAAPSENRQAPLDVLKERYARGEINRDQYETMKQDLQ